MKYFTQILFGIILSFISTHLIAAIPIVKPAAPNINARGYLLMDYYSGRLLAEKNVHEHFIRAENSDAGPNFQFL